MTPLTSFPWKPPTAWAYRIFLGLWMLIYTGAYGVGVYSAWDKGLAMSTTATLGVLGPLAAAALTVWWAPRLGWCLALLGTAALTWRLLRSMPVQPGVFISFLLWIPVLSGIPLGWLEHRRQSSRRR